MFVKFLDTTAIDGHPKQEWPAVSEEAKEIATSYAIAGSEIPENSNYLGLLIVNGGCPSMRDVALNFVSAYRILEMKTESELNVVIPALSFSFIRILD